MRKTYKKIIATASGLIIIFSIIGLAICIINDGQTEIKTFRERQQEYWGEWAKQKSYDMAFSEWGNFDCTFNNKTLVLETECGGDGYMTITIFSSPVVNISLGYWDKYQTTEKWEERNGEIWIKDADENVLVIPKEWIIPEKYPEFFELINISVPSWKSYTPSNTWTGHTINIRDNISSNITIIVRKNIESVNNYDERTYRFVPVIYTFEVRT